MDIQIGKGHIVRRGDVIVIFAFGTVLEYALGAAEKINAFLLKGLKAQDQIDLLNKKQKDIIDAVDLKVKGIEDELTEAAYAETALKYDIDPAELKNLKEYRYGGKVTETGLAMVHGSDRHPEIMFDNIQVDRMEDYLLMLKEMREEEAMISLLKI